MLEGLAEEPAPRSSIIINDDLLVDIGPDIATESFEHNLSLANISVCLQTHAHEDHLDTEFIISRHTEYGTVVSCDLLFVGSSENPESCGCDCVSKM